MRAISVENLSKQFRIEPKQARLSETLLGQLTGSMLDGIRDAARRVRQGRSPDPEPVLHWALRNVSFEVQAGEVVGIIGHNGAGKSTLLKILSRITHPTSGLARVNGRMSSLLEVGTGFHPDLSGRDNVLMNAAILGMTRAEIARRFDAIVEFSGVEEYIDTPIKHYSSGMKVRLAFAVAAHLEPEIMVVDEVLAVGDAAFQRRSLQRMEEVGSSGRTVLFVSHQLTTVARLCSRVIVLDHGQIAFDGRTLQAIRYYNERLGGVRLRREWHGGEQPGDKVARLQSVEVLDVDGPATGPIDVRKRIGVRVRYAVREGDNQITPSVHLFDSGGNWIFAAMDLHSEWATRARPAGDYETMAWIPANLLNEGYYVLSVALATLDPYRPRCFAHDCVGFNVFDPMHGDTARGRYPGEMPGVIRPILEWTTHRG